MYLYTRFIPPWNIRRHIVAFIENEPYRSNIELIFSVAYTGLQSWWTELPPGLPPLDIVYSSLSVHFASYQLCNVIYQTADSNLT